MNTQSRATIVSWSTAGEEVCASAARISTTQGDAGALFQQAQGNPKNRDLIRKVLASGHRSVAEHAVFSIALENVSVYVEQFFIECRLASFTVKSRRYVDFSGLGYYIPPELEGEARASYQKYMDGLFGAYQAILADGVPKEDARFLLPYSLCSNFYCTLNARELARVIQAMRTGRGRGIPELQDLARQLEEQLEERFPCLLSELYGDDAEASEALPPLLGEEPVFVSEAESGNVQLLAGPADPMALLEAAHRAEDPRGTAAFSMKALVASQRPRALEQLNYTFRIADVTLSGITHLVRHRMQSIIVPPIQGLDHTRYILPDTIRDNAPAREKYEAALAEAARQAKEMAEDPVLRRYNYYYAVSGNVMDVMTTLNARELQLFLRLRTCSRAQWEVREIAVDMLRLLRESFPELFDGFGPSCYLMGKCPEGRMTCGQSEAVRARFGGKL